MSLFRKPDLKNGSTMPASSAGAFHGWRYLFFFLGAIVLAVLWYAQENWRGKWAWEKYKNRLEAQGERLAAAAYVPPMVPDDENFAMTPFLAPLYAFQPGTQQWRDPTALSRINGFAPRFNAASSVLMKEKVPFRSNSWVKARTDLRAWDAAFSEGTNHAHGQRIDRVLTNVSPAEAAKSVLGELAETEPVIEELRAAAQRRYCRFNIRYEEENPAGILLPHLAALKHLCQVLQLRASAELALGQNDSAFEDTKLLLYLAQASADEPVLISHLVRRTEVQMAFQPLAEGLADHRWTESQLLWFQQQFEKLDFCADTKRVLGAERALFGGAVIDYLRRSPDRRGLLSDMGNSADGHSGSGDWAGMLWVVVPSGWFYFEQLDYCRTFQDYLLPPIGADGRISPAASLRASQRMSALTSNSPVALMLHHELFSALLLPGVSGVFQKTAFAQTGVEAVAVACALERYRLAHEKFPESLEALVPQFLAHVPRDVINGQPLKYRRGESNQYTVYSVGWNEIDDRGMLVPAKSGDGLELNQGDWVWQLELEDSGSSAAR